MKPIVFGSFCSGIGAPEVAWHDILGWESKFVSEIEPFPSAVLKARWPNVPNLGDFTAIPAEQMQGLDVLIAGTPCQAFSVAGLRQSLSDDRGNLTLSYVKHIHASRSLFCAAWENVPGVLNTSDNAFGCFLGALVGADDPVIPCSPPPVGKSNKVWRWRDEGDYPVLDDDGNETGEFTHVAAGHFPAWPSVGMVAGPLGRAAWRILNAQYFGVPQRRRRVILVFCPVASGGDPAKILFERKGVSGDFAPGGEEGQDIAGTLSARTQGGGGLGTDFELSGGLQTVNTRYLGNAEGGAIDLPSLTVSNLEKLVHNQAPMIGVPQLARSLRAQGNSAHREDLETYIPEVALTLRPEGFDASEDGTGRQNLIPIISGPLTSGMASSAARMPHEQGALIPELVCGNCGESFTDRHGSGIGSLAPFECPQCGEEQDLSPIAFDCKASGQSGFGVGDIASTLRSMGHADSHQNGGGHAAVAFAIRGREGGAQVEIEGDKTGAQRAGNGGSSNSYVAQETVQSYSWKVRRLVPVEYARLQGFPDDHTDINIRNQPAADGPQYKGYGNSMAMPKILWLGRRIEAHYREVKNL